MDEGGKPDMVASPLIVIPCSSDCDSLFLTKLQYPVAYRCYRIHSPLSLTRLA